MLGMLCIDRDWVWTWQREFKANIFLLWDSYNIMFHIRCCVVCIRSTPWTCSSARCGLMSGWNSRAQLKSCGSTTAWWKRSGYRTHFSETQRSLFLTTWRRQTNCSASWRMALSSIPWGDLTLQRLFMRVLVFFTEIEGSDVFLCVLLLSDWQSAQTARWGW